MSPHRLVVALLTGACALLASCPPALAARVVRCESQSSRYRYCRVDTHGKVKVKKQLSDKDCQRGRTWGFDRSGIWVDHGCRADFSVGGGGGSDSGSSTGSSVALGLGAAAGVALLGALLNGQDSSAKAPVADAQAAYPAGGGSSASQANPNQWTVGTFSGYDARRKTELQLTLSPNGQALAEIPKHASVAGFVQGDVLRLGDEVFTLSPEGSGLRATRSGNGGDILFGRLR
ncbi:MAG: DUF3011 domain-containing protein [bacterium]